MAKGLLCAALLGMMAASMGCAASWQHDEQLFARAWEHQRRGELEQALELYRQLQPRERRYTGALNNMALILMERRQPAEAEAALRAALAIDDDDLLLWLNLGVARCWQGDDMGAIDALVEVAAAGERLLRRTIAGPGADYSHYRETLQLVRRVKRKARRLLVALRRAKQAGAEGRSFCRERQLSPASRPARPRPREGQRILPM